MDMNKNSSIDNDLDLLFKPVTQGLGFNKKENIPDFPKKRTAIKSEVGPQWSDTNIIRKNLQQDVRTNISSELPKRKPLGLASASAAAAATRNPSANTKADASVESAINLFHKFFSWLIDSSLVLFSAMFSTVAIEYFFTSSLRLEVLSSMENWIYITGPLFSFYFVFYYSIFWKTTQKTLGMSIFDLRISSKESSDINLKQTFLRSLISFISMFTFGIVEILGLPDALTWTSVSKDA